MSIPLIIGAGHNALVAAFYLARAGLKPLVLEQRPIVGGCAITEEIAPGYRCSTLAHATGPLRRSIVRDMQLARRVEFIQPDPTLVALTPEGQYASGALRPGFEVAVKTNSVDEVVPPDVVLLA